MLIRACGCSLPCVLGNGEGLPDGPMDEDKVDRLDIDLHFHEVADPLAIAILAANRQRDGSDGNSTSP